MPKDITTIPLTKTTRDRLKALGRKGETYDELLNRIMDAYEPDAEASADADAGAYTTFEKVE